MYKLLPDANREEIKREYSSRRLVVALILVSLALLFSLLSALPSLIEVEAKRDAAVLLSESAVNASGAADRAELESWAAKTKMTLQALAPNLGDDPHASFERVLAARSSGIKLTGFSWQRVSGIVSIKVRGVATDRQALLSFRDTLNSSGVWQGVELPVSALAADRDIGFELTLTPK